MQLTKLIYTSNHGGLDAEACEDILLRSRTNNERDGITGTLLVTNEDFMQILEGGRTVVAECFMRIMKDDRHQQIRILLVCEEDTRMFPEWSMHSIRTSRIKRSIVSRYLIDGIFSPARMSQAAIEELCQALATSAGRG
ncbi:BLUF domain-containing protein [Paracoccus liaowanqingii]|uniref:BLUF domain-containing protein n=1 Tax=Paracoccus liaowanqingii TaxID=2560053 RepID=A0A4Z1B8W9_9RHOB|nr:BLUF domain-containing protein [Paracoccus liaowanqingii]